MNMDEKKRVQHWEKIFSDSEEGSSSSIIKTEKRLNVSTYTAMNFLQSIFSIRLIHAGNRRSFVGVI